MFNFTPDQPSAAQIKVPYLEDATADTAPYYSSTRSVEAAKTEVADRLDALGGNILSFVGGTFEINKQKRFGFVIRFALNVHPFSNAEGIIRVAGLPIRIPSDAKEKRVKVQALLNVADWLKTAMTSRIFSPDAHPLVPYLLMPSKDGQLHTVTEAISQLVNRVDVPLIDSGLQ
jgi:hypothetical protein